MHAHTPIASGETAHCGIRDEGTQDLFAFPSRKMNPLVLKDRKMKPPAGNTEISPLDFGSVSLEKFCGYLMGDLAEPAIKWFMNSGNGFLCNSYFSFLIHTACSYPRRSSGGKKLRCTKGKKSGPCLR